MRNGYRLFENSNPGYRERGNICNGATNINYNVDYDPVSENEKYACSAFAGHAMLDENCAVSFADFGALPKNNHYRLAGESYEQMLYNVFEDNSKAEFAFFTEEEESYVAHILPQEIVAMAKVYDYLTATAANVMSVHTPKVV